METILIKREGKLVEIPFDELTIEEEEIIAHSSMGTTLYTAEKRMQGLSDYEIIKNKEENPSEILQNKSKDIKIKKR